jgi:hypothetical protein
MPTFQAVFNLAVAAFVPFLMLPLIPTTELGTYDTWFVGAIATLLGATAVRGHSYLAVTGLILLIAQVLLWGGPQTIASTGLFGAVLFVASGSLMSLGFQRVNQEAAEHNRRSLDVAVSSAYESAANREFEKRISVALSTALPLLEKIAQSEHQIPSDVKAEATRLEATLRDEIRGESLITDEIREAVASARARGVDVVLLDEGGLKSTPETDRRELLRQAAAAIDGVAAGRITLRSPADADYRVSLLATRPGEPKPDLWLRLG